MEADRKIGLRCFAANQTHFKKIGTKTHFRCYH